MCYASLYDIYTTIHIHLLYLPVTINLPTLAFLLLLYCSFPPNYISYIYLYTYISIITITFFFLLLFCLAVTVVTVFTLGVYLCTRCFYDQPCCIREGYEMMKDGLRVVVFGCVLQEGSGRRRRRRRRYFSCGLRRVT